jgi:hypothetical protein
MRTTSVASLRSLGIAITPAIAMEEDDRKECSRWNGGSYLYKKLCHASQLRGGTDGDARQRLSGADEALVLPNSHEAAEYGTLKC